jgi:hypothetical protein
MPFLLNLETREITEILTEPEGPPSEWRSVFVKIQLVNEGGLGPEYTPAEYRALYNRDNVQLIFQTRDQAFDVEYWTRESVGITWTWGNPCPIFF